MFFDGLLIIAAMVLCVNGWHRGLLRSWRGPIAMVVTTLIVQHLYVDFATWLVSRLRITPEMAVLVGYLILWFSIESVLEIVLAMLLKGGIQNRPIFFDRVGGVAYGLFKTLVIIILPLMAISIKLKIPPAPEDKSGLKIVSMSMPEQTILISGFKTVAESLLPIVGNYVVSDKPPSFTPVFEKVENEETQQSLDKKNTQRDIQNLLD